MYIYIYIYKTDPRPEAVDAVAPEGLVEASNS